MPVHRGDGSRGDGGHLRDVTDQSLASTVKLITWNEENLEKAVFSILRSGAEYDHSTLLLSPEDLARVMVEIRGQVFALGDGGVAFFNPIVPGFHGTCHIYVWNPMYLRRHDLIKSTLAWSFKNWDLQRIHCAVPSRNTVSWRFVEKLGFTREGVMRRFIRYNGGMDDAFLYGLLPEEL